MKQYLNLLDKILQEGYQTTDRTGTGTITLPGNQYKVHLYKDDNGLIHNFPLLTTKKMSLKSIFEELKWKLSGDTNIRYLLQNNNHIWTEWVFYKYLEEHNLLHKIPMWSDESRSTFSNAWIQAKEDFEIKILCNDEFAEKYGDLGHVYGYQFRNFNGVDQLMNAIDDIKNRPDSRRIIINLWNSSDIDNMLLPPCPCFYQFYANEDGYLHLQMYQRSCDMFLGVPYNTAQDALFLCMMAHVTGRKPGTFIHTFGDSHIYLNHVDQVKIQLEREPRPLPKLLINKNVKSIFDFEFYDFVLHDYDPHPRIKGSVSI